MNVRCFRFLILVLLSKILFTWSAKILTVLTTPCRSHFIVGMAVVESLIDRGHDLTVVTNMPLKDSNPRFKYIKVKTSVNLEELMKNIMQTSTSPTTVLTLLNDLFRFYPAVLTVCDEALRDSEVQRLKSEASFDLLLLDYFGNDFQLGLAGHFNCPIVMLWSTKPAIMINQMVGVSPELAYVPQFFNIEKQPLSFSAKITNILLGAVELIGVFIAYTMQNSYYELHFPRNKYPPLEKIIQNISLVLNNHHFSQGPIRPTVQAMVEIGGIQIKGKPNSLPMDIQAFLDDAGKDGAIYFSFGSIIQSSKLNEKNLKIMYNVLSSLQQRILWKWENNQYPGNSSNILYKHWLPQDDILAHENVKLFITHGGKGGLSESQYHGVPMVAIPFFADQISNVHVMAANGYGLVLDFAEITEASFRSALEEVLGNPKYKHQIKKFSELYKDRPQSAKETAVFWVEYVIRHHGAPHMKSQRVHMNWWRILYLDILALLLTISLVTVFVMKLLLRRMSRKTGAIMKIKRKKQQ